MKKSKKTKLSASEKLSGFSNIPFDMMLTRPYIRMCSNREIIVEDAGKLVHYNGECVKIMQKRMCVCVCGENLKLLCLANNDMRVVGFIKTVSFE